MDKKDLKKVNGGHDWYQCSACGSHFTDGDVYEAHYERYHADDVRRYQENHRNYVENNRNYETPKHYYRPDTNQG